MQLRKPDPVTYMSESRGKALDVLMQYATFAEQCCGADKAKLHDIEYELGGRTFWIWAEMESVTDKVRGIALSCTKRHWRNDMSRTEAADCLAGESIFGKEHFVEWIGNHGAEYPDFLRYMLAIEGLRLAAITYLQTSW